ncbi:NB-ARC domain-containing protein [Roseibium album]|uniref:Tol-Pal system beta propeller repeat protein TolB n=1 Tax=Roseibium album TaxID=311410 RepID=A0A0M6ZSD7_9HYPH|nr:NB-ARC domain-containing protein [Roseibium album]CTQ58140.1 Tol-Pal system beta propeller repeat protein TolB [Roseibium album]CTQ65665.1 Tol-Pal system beta propeller repeat protein TolB [Roseibium album]CTQ70547.1 Tol-Pal system beta propeller repeat protein TolB [Roseibium album]
MKSLPNIPFTEFSDRIKKELDSEQKQCTEDEYEELVGRQCKLFRDVRFGKGTPGIDAKLAKWISDIEEAVGEEIWEIVKNLSSSKLDDIEDCKAATIHAIVIHYRLHGELELPGIAKEIDKKIFDKKSAKLIFKRSVFEAINDDEVPIPPTWSDRDFLNDAYQSERPEFEELKSFLCPEEEASIPSSIAIYGPGGYGKSSLALEICHDWEVQGQFPGGIYWLQFGLIDSRDQKAGNITLQQAIMNMIAQQYSKNERSEIALEGRDEDIQILRKVLPRQRLLIIADDIWTITQANWLSKHLEDVVIVFTTRIERVAKFSSEIIPIQKLPDETSLALLTDGMTNITRGQKVQLRELSRRFNGWPLILNLANGIFKRIQNSNEDTVSYSIARYKKFLERDKIDSLDVEWLGEEEIEKRRKLVGHCIEASLSFIAPNMNPELVRQLGVFPDGSEIPIPVIIDLWMRDKTHGLDSDELKERIKHFREFSLFQPIDANSETIKLHDEISAYLRSWNKRERNLSSLHEQLLESMRTFCPCGWDDLPHDHQYGWKNLLYHMEKAEQIDCANELRMNFGWLKSKLKAVGIAELQQSFLSDKQSVEALKVGHAVNLSVPALRMSPASLAHQLFGYLGHETADDYISLLSDALKDPDCWPTPLYPYLPRLGSELLKLEGHRGVVNNASWSPDGKTVVTASVDRTVRLWDAETSQQIGEPFAGHTDSVLCARFSYDGTKIVTASKDGTSRIFNVDGSSLCNPFEHNCSVVSAEFSKDGAKIVTVSSDGTANIWKVPDGKRISTIKIDNGNIDSATFSSDGTKVLLSDPINLSAYLWSNMDSIGLIHLQHDNLFNNCSFSKDGKEIISMMFDEIVQFRDAESGELKASFPDYILSQSGAEELRENLGQLCVPCSDSNAVLIYDVLEDRNDVKFINFDSPMNTVEVNLTGNKVVSVSRDGICQIWDADKKNPRVSDEKYWRSNFLISGNGSRVLEMSLDMRFGQIWDITEGKLITQKIPILSGGKKYSAHNGLLEQIEDHRVRAITIDYLGQDIAINEYADELRIWSTSAHANAATLRSSQFKSHISKGTSKSISRAEFLKKGKRLAVRSGLDTAYIWDYEKNSTIGKPVSGSLFDVNLFDCECRKHFSVRDNFTAIIQNVEDGEILNDEVKHSDIINDADFNHDATMLITASDDGTACLWDLNENCSKEHSLSHSGPVNTAKFGLDGTLVVTASDDKSVRVWNTKNGLQIYDQLEHPSRVICALLTKDNRRVVSAANDNIIRIWNLGSSCDPILIHLDRKPQCLSLHGEILNVERIGLFNLSQNTKTSEFFNSLKAQTLARPVSNGAKMRKGRRKRN